MSATHEVINQVPPIVGHDISTFPALLEGLRREGAGWAEGEIRELGVLANSEEPQLWGRLVNEHPPVLHTHDRYGVRVDEVEYLPEYHKLMQVAVEHGLGGAPWASDRPGGHVARAAKLMTWGVTDFGHLCPISMIYSVVPALRSTPELAAQYEPLLTAREYDYKLRSPLTKRGLIAGMSMTEKQGGSDVRANTTTATPIGDGTGLIARARGPLIPGTPSVTVLRLPRQVPPLAVIGTPVREPLRGRAVLLPPPLTQMSTAISHPAQSLQFLAQLSEVGRRGSGGVATRGRTW